MKEKLDILFQIVLFPIVFMLFLSGYASAATPIYPIDSKVYGKSYLEWVLEKSWWMYERSTLNDPIADKSGSLCASKQTGPVWYLAGSYGGKVTRECTIPAGKAIMISLVETICSDADYPSLGNDSMSLKTCVKQDLGELRRVTLEVDGVELNLNPEVHRIQTHMFQLNLPDGNSFFATNEKAGNYSAIVEGIFVILKPLSVGKHELKFGAEEISLEGTTRNPWSYEVTYKISVI